MVFVIVFNAEKTLLFNTGINLFSIAILSIVLYSCWRFSPNSQGMRLFRRTMTLVIATLFTDTVMWLINGKPGQALCIISYLDNMAYFILQLAVVLNWLRYAWYRIYGKMMPRKIERFAVVLPFLVIIAVVVSSPWTHWCFYLDENNIYRRGQASAALAIIALCYMVAASVMALLRRRSEILSERRSEYFVLSFFAVPPLLFGMLQTAIYGFSLLWPSATISVLLIYINITNHAISQDALTGLNNRGNLDRYLYTVAANSHNRPFVILMLDVNQFKTINDRFGHEAGDTALIRTAEVLKKTFNGTSAFLARYGGDEFVVVLADSGREEADRANEMIRENFRSFNETHRLQYDLTASIGSAVSLVDSAEDVSKLLNAADRNMYLEKQTLHCGRDQAAG